MTNFYEKDFDIFLNKLLNSKEYTILEAFNLLPKLTNPGLYLLYNTNSNLYAGKANKAIANRLALHLSTLTSPEIDMKKLDISAIKIKVVECNSAIVEALEQYVIKKLKPIWNDQKYGFGRTNPSILGKLENLSKFKETYWKYESIMDEFKRQVEVIYLQVGEKIKKDQEKFLRSYELNK